jgi:multidrug efflux pump subunit AcrA (membrane-fusion protein)
MRNWTAELEAALDDPERYHLEWTRGQRRAIRAGANVNAFQSLVDMEQHLITIAELRIDKARLQAYAADLQRQLDAARDDLAELKQKEA